MIYDDLRNIKRYLGIDKNLDTAINYLLNHDLKDQTVGKYVIDDNVYYSVQQYIAKDEKDCFYETHHNHIDIQLILQGKENMYSKDSFAKMEEKEEYNSQTDMHLFKRDNTNAALREVRENQFAIFFANEYHMPGVKVDDKEVKKVLVKISV